MAQGTLPRQPILGSKLAKSADSFSFVALAFQNKVQYRHSGSKIFICYDLATSCKNLVNFGPVTSGFTVAKDVHPVVFFKKINLSDKYDGPWCVAEVLVAVIVTSSLHWISSCWAERVKVKNEGQRRYKSDVTVGSRLFLVTRTERASCTDTYTLTIRRLSCLIPWGINLARPACFCYAKRL